MIGASVWLDPPARRVFGDFPHEGTAFGCALLVSMLYAIEALTNSDANGASDTLTRRIGELPRQPFGLSILDVQAHGRSLPL